MLNIKLIKSSKEFLINYSYLIMDEINSTAVIIDPSWADEIITKILSDNRIDKKYILLTHSHFDHIYSANKLAKFFKCNIYVSAVESKAYGYIPINYIPIYEGEINLGGVDITIIDTPGHTLGSQCFLIEDNLFTGDTVFIEGCGLTWGKGGSAANMFESISKLKHMIKKDTNIYPGHSYGKNPGIKFKYILDYNIYFNFNNESDFISFRERKGQKNWENFK